MKVVIGHMIWNCESSHNTTLEENLPITIIHNCDLAIVTHDKNLHK